MNCSSARIASVLASVLLLLISAPWSLADDATPPSSTPTPPPPTEPAAVIPYTNDFATDPFHPNDSSLRWWVNNADQASWVKDVVHDGKGAIKLTNADNTKNTVTYGPYIPYTGPAISISAEIKTDSIVGNGSGKKATVSIYYYDSQRNQITVPYPGYHDSQTIPDGTSDWTSYIQQYSLPPNAADIAYVRVVVNLIGTGTLWLDKVTLH